MSSAAVRIDVIDTSGSKEQCVLRYSEGPPWRVELELADGRQWAASGENLFAALREVRIEIERIGLMPCCNGARKDAWPSPRSAESGAQLIYLIPAWRWPGIRDLVPLVAPCSPKKLGTVADQESRMEKTFGSRLRYLSLVNPSWWWKSIEGRVRGPRRWIPIEGDEGFTTWKQLG